VQIWYWPVAQRPVEALTAGVLEEPQTFGDDQITVAEGSYVELDQDFIIWKKADGSLLVELQAVEAF